MIMRRVLKQAISGDPALEVVGMGVDGSEGVALVEQLNPDLVTLDLEMPNLDGAATLHQLRLRRIELRIILVSGYGQELATERFGITGEVHAFLSKPYEQAELVAAVNQALEPPPN